MGTVEATFLEKLNRYFVTAPRRWISAPSTPFPHLRSIFPHLDLCNKIYWILLANLSPQFILFEAIFHSTDVFTSPLFPFFWIYCPERMKYCPEPMKYCPQIKNTVRNLLFTIRSIFPSELNEIRAIPRHIKKTARISLADSFSSFFIALWLQR